MRHLYVIHGNSGIVCEITNLPDNEDIKIETEYVRWKGMTLRVVGRRDKPGHEYYTKKNVIWFSLCHADEKESMDDISAIMTRVIEMSATIDEMPDCDNCDDRMGDPPDYSWRD